MLKLEVGKTVRVAVQGNVNEIARDMLLGIKAVYEGMQEKSQPMADCFLLFLQEQMKTLNTSLWAEKGTAPDDEAPGAALKEK